ncbi:MAG: hypothetical protein J1E06_11365 [Acutalibacter sp.]|nr:hypothetical protein [Acutalibacter sp.]
MRNPTEFQEIENLGENEEFQEEFYEKEDFSEYDPYAPREEKRQDRGSILPLLQTALCVMALLTLLILKIARPETYSKATQWYQSEAAREIELPKFGEKEELSSLPSAVSSETPIAADMDSDSLQKL